jgi:hypothetical protein
LCFGGNCQALEGTDFLAVQLDVATCMDYTGIDPFSKEVYIARKLRERMAQRALIQLY